MKKRSHHSSVHHRHHERPVRFLPIHGRYITPVFKFSNVRGMARLFLEIEITLVIFILGGTFLAALLRILSSFFK